MGHFTCDESDFVLIVCDGVSEAPSFPNRDVCEVAAKALRDSGGDAALASERVIEMALKAGSRDNISCMIVLLDARLGARWAPHPPRDMASRPVPVYFFLVGRHRRWSQSRSRSLLLNLLPGRPFDTVTLALQPAPCSSSRAALGTLV